MSDASVEVLVIGGGPAGIGAAVAAARMGRRVALIERHPILGGMGTAALVNNFCNAHKVPSRRLIIGGIFAELRQRLIDRKAIYGTQLDPAFWMEAYNPDVFLEQVTTMCREAGVQTLLGRSIRKMSFNAATHADLDDGSSLNAQTVVDATGDATAAFVAGVPFNFGRPGDHAVMPLTYCYSIGPIDLEKVRREMPFAIRRDAVTGEEHVFIEEHTQVNAWVKLARERGELTIPRKHIVSITSIPGNTSTATVNFGRVFCDDPTDPAKLAVAEAQGKQQVEEGIRFYRKYLPGFENVGLVQLARQIGVRETRQIQGLYTLTADDVVSGRQFDDVIAQCCYGIDIHEPGTDGTVIKWVQGEDHYDIPWRCLVPSAGPSNLIVAGRCISATHEAMSSFRVSPSVMAIGEAAGVTAALAAAGATPIAKVPITDIQNRLTATGGILK